VARIEERRGAYRNFVGKPERKKPFRRRTHRWKDNRKDLIKVGWEGVDQIWCDSG
jgi:hypothetical protein